jgi:hypothetical protein
MEPIISRTTREGKFSLGDRYFKEVRNVLLAYRGNTLVDEYPSASAITLPYNVTERRILDIDEKIVVPSTFLHSLLWIDIVVNGKDIQGQGELLFPNGERLVSPGQCYTSIDLVNILMQYFHQQTPKQTWRSLQQNALDALCGVRAPSSQVRAMCQQIIADKRRKATAEEDEA